MEEVKKQGMESLFVPYQIALALKELGFDEPCLGHYQDRDETTLHGAVATSKNVYFSIGETNKGFIVRNSRISNCVLAPLYQQAFRWFREKYQLVNYIEYYAEWNFEIFRIDDKIAEVQDDVNVDYTFKGGTYEQAQLECLKKLIEIAKSK
jgi:hypothetical protein